MLKFRDYVYSLYRSIFYQKGKLISDEGHLLKFEFTYPFPDNKNNFKTFRLHLPYKEARVSDLEERNLLIYFDDTKYKKYIRYKTPKIKKEQEFAIYRLKKAILKGMIEDDLRLLSYLIFDWLFLRFCLVITEITGEIRFGKRNLNQFRREQGTFFYAPFLWAIPYYIMKFFQYSSHILLNLYEEYSSFGDIITQNHKIQYLNKIPGMNLWEREKSVFPLYTKRDERYLILIGKRLSKSEINSLKDCITRKHVNISKDLNILNKEKIKINWFEILKSEFSNRNYGVCFWYNKFCETHQFPALFLISLGNRKMF